MVFLFWNVNQRSLTSVISSIAREHGAGVIVLAECVGTVGELLNALNSGAVPLYHYLPARVSTRTQVFATFSQDFAELTLETEHVAIRRLRLPGTPELLLVTLHLPSKLYRSAESKQFESAELTRLIEEQEESSGHRRTLVVGDFNMDPFEAGITGAGGLHGVLSAKVARRGSRVIADRTYPFFYNPMWSRMGDLSPGPPGSYYYTRAEHMCQFWHMFDQVLVRPDLIDAFDGSSLRILSDFGHESLLTARGLPNTETFSDHLPLMFNVRL